jgi:hypothetical protein
MRRAEQSRTPNRDASAGFLEIHNERRRNMQRNLRKAHAAVLFTAMLFGASRSHAQSQNPTSMQLTGAQCKVILQALQTDAQSSGKTSMTPGQAQILAQCPTVEGQAGTNPALTAAQSQLSLQSFGAQNQTAPTRGGGQAVPQNPAQPLGAPGQAPLGPKKLAIRIGVTQPKAQMGQGNSGANVAEPIRAMIIQYLAGPSQEVVPIAAMIPTQIDAEAASKQCDYVLYSAMSQKVGGGGLGLLKMIGPMASMVPGVGMIAGGAAGAMTTVGVGAIMSGTASAASTVKAKSEVTFEYKLMAPGNTNPVVANTETVKAKENGEDVISPLVEHAATAILAGVSKKK